MTTTEQESLIDKIESAGFDYAIVEYGGNIKDPDFNRLREAYLSESLALAVYLEVDI